MGLKVVDATENFRTWLEKSYIDTLLSRKSG